MLSPGLIRGLILFVTPDLIRGLIIQSSVYYFSQMPGPRIKRGAGEPGMTYFVSCHPGPDAGSYTVCHPGLDPGSYLIPIRSEIF